MEEIADEQEMKQGVHMDNFIDKFAQRRNAQDMIRANAMAEAEERERIAAKLSEYELAMQELRRCNLQNLENAEKVKELLAASLYKIEEVQKKDAGVSERPEKTVEEVRALLEGLKNQVAQTVRDQQSRTAELFERQQSRMSALLEEQGNQTSKMLERQQSLISALLAKQKDQLAELLKEQGSLLEGREGLTKELLEEQNAQTKELLETQQKGIEELLHGSDEFSHREAVKVYRNVQAVIEGALPRQTKEITEALKSAEGKRGAFAGITVLVVLTFFAAAANIVIEVLKILGYL